MNLPTTNFKDGDGIGINAHCLRMSYSKVLYYYGLHLWQACYHKLLFYDILICKNIDIGNGCFVEARRRRDSYDVYSPRPVIVLSILQH